MRRTVIPALLLATLGAVAPARAERFTVQGWVTFETEAVNSPGADLWWFDLHHFNVVTNYVIDPHWRVLGEIEWEHGVDLGDGASSGAVRLEQGWAEWDGGRLRVRFGKMLTPWGAYNEIHDATPLFVFPEVPSSIYGRHVVVPGQTADRLFAKKAVGVAARKVVAVGAGRLSFDAMLSNGRGDDPGEFDTDTNKGLALRTAYADGREHLRAGLSFYGDRNAARGGRRETSGAADLQVAPWGPGSGVELGAEAAVSRVEPPGAPDARYEGGYVALFVNATESTVGWVRYERIDADARIDGGVEEAYAVGVSQDATESVRLKGALFFDATSPGAPERFLATVSVRF
jgi:hypothetical protein